MELRQLERKDYAGHTFTARYTTDSVYQVTATDWSFSLQRRALEKSQEFGFTDSLFGDWLEDPVVFGLWDGQTLAAFVEGSVETWHRLFRVSNLYVEPAYRRQSLGRRLLTHMLDYAGTIPGCRGVILETQNCNVPAISLYTRLGFRLCRVDTHEYSNQDLARNQIRLDFIRVL